MAHRSRARFVLATVLGSAAIAAVALLGVHPAEAAESFAVPSPAVDEPASATGTETAVFAGGCFWGVQGVFQHVIGVTQAESGYAGGTEATAQYETVGTGSTGHAESVRITYDPSQVTFGQLLHVFFSVAHDPTELNRQGPDVGSQYRSAIFPQGDEQRRIADAYIAQLNAANVFGASLVTKTDADRGFFPAEDYHQDYLDLNPTASYIVTNDIPKIDALKQMFPDLYREQPVLVRPKAS
jgi:peptide-methionine (S)-S-oxide reductase